MKIQEELKKEIKELLYFNEREINKIKKIIEELDKKGEIKKLKDTNKEIADLVLSYYEDLIYFHKKKEIIKSFELVNYLWGYLDCLANLKLINPSEEIKKWFKIEQTK